MSETTSTRFDQLPPISEEELLRAMPKRRLGLVGWAIVAVVGFVVLPLIGYSCWYGLAWKRFDAKMSELAKSQPVTIAGMDEFYSLPDDVFDSTELYLSVSQVMSSAKFKADMAGVAFIDINDTPPTKIGTWDGTAPGRKLLDQYESELQKLYKACEQGGAARYPIDFKDGFLTTLEHAQNIHYLSSFLFLDAWVNAHEGKSAGVARAIRTAFATARSLEHEPVLVSQIIHMRRTENVLDELEKLLSVVDFTDEELLAMQTELRKFDIRKSLRRGFIGEQGMCMIALSDADHEQIKMGLNEKGRSGVPEWLLAKLGSRFDDLLLYTECNAGFIAATDQPWTDAIKSASTITVTTRERTEGQFRGIRYGLTRLCLSVPDYPGNLFGIAAVTETKLKLMEVLLAVRRFQIQHDRQPKNIEELVPRFLSEVPLDPCDPTNHIELTLNDGVVEVSSSGISGEQISELPSNFAQPPRTGPISMKLRLERN